VLEVKNVSKQYKGEDKLLFDAVSDVSLSMADHRIYALVGESGCGKSTLSRLILGLEFPSSGQILLDGKPISRKRKNNRKETAKAIQLVLQDGKSALDPHFTVYQVIAEPLRNLLALPKDRNGQEFMNCLTAWNCPKNRQQRKQGNYPAGSKSA
jgi:ABC-type dipeptide/oligopeptide/nickel transport system ATPase subunit